MDTTQRKPIPVCWDNRYKLPIPIPVGSKVLESVNGDCYIMKEDGTLEYKKEIK